MVTILYAVTRTGYFCKKETPDKKVDDLSWMRVPTDRIFFRELTTLHANQPILVGSKTAQVLPKLKDREIISISMCSDRGIPLHYALERYPSAILIGGAKLLVSAMKPPHRKHINSVITVRLPIGIPSQDDEKDYIKDPLLSFKAPRMLKKSSQFFMYTDNYEQPTILTEIWRPTWS